MSTDLVPHPKTGEALSLDAPTGTLAAYHDDLQELERIVREARGRIGEELLKRLDVKAKWTWREDGFEIKAPSPAPTTEYDVDAVRATLRDLQDEGVIDEDAADAAVQVTVSYKARVAGLNALRKLGDDVADRIDACGQPVEKPRRVSVKPVRER